MVDQGPVETQDVSVSGLADTATTSSEITANTSSGMDLPRTATGPSGLSVEWADFVDDRSIDEAVLRDTGSWRDGLAITRWTSWWNRGLP